MRQESPQSYGPMEGVPHEDLITGGTAIRELGVYPGLRQQ